MSEFNVSAVSLKAQKKLASSLSGRRSARLVLNDSTNRVLDALYRALLLASMTRREAERITKSLIKVAIKVGLLARNDQFEADELTIVEGIGAKFRQLAMTIASFHSVDYSYDRHFLICQLESCQSALSALVARHVTEKSSDKIVELFEQLKQPALLDRMFQCETGSQLHLAMGQLCRQLELIVETGLV